MKETEIQSEICRDLKDEDSSTVAYKQSNQFLSGPPDLIIARKSHPLMMLEVKTAKWGPKLAQTGFEVGLSALQSNWLRDLQAAGVICGWAMVVQIRNGERAMFVSRDRFMLRTPPLPSAHPTWWYTRGRGERWSYLHIADQLNVHHATYEHKVL